jgi:cyanuric acid amidohydrolase
MRCDVFRVPITAPDDVAGILALIEHGQLAARDVVAVLGKTEGNGCVNDYSRGLAVRRLTELFAGYVGEDGARQILYIMSGGTEGVLCPHLTVIARSPDRGAASSARKALAVGVARTPTLGPEQIGRTAQAMLVAEAVRAAMVDARIDRAADVHFIQVKCPLLNTEALMAAEARGLTTATDDTYKSMGYSRGASSLGVALALGEVDLADVTDDVVCRRWDRYSSVASASAGSEVSQCEVLVVGNSEHATGDLVVAHDVMRDAIDVEAVRRAATRAGYADEGARARDAGGVGQAVEFVQAFAKAEADPGGRVRSRRHTMLSDSDINHTRHARAVVGGVVASYFGDTMVYVSGGAEHQGPSGGGPVAVIVRRLPVELAPSTHSKGFT